MEKLINELPKDIKFSILKNLIEDNFAENNPEVFNSKVKLITKEIKTYELILDVGSKVKRWYFTGDLVNNEIDIWINEMALSKKNTSRNLLQYFNINFSNLKRLMINDPIDYNRFKLNQLNKFINLYHLEIRNYSGNFASLDLPNLKILYIDSIFIGGVVVKSPKLKVLKTNIGLSQLKLKHPESVFHLDVHSYEQELFGFKNVEYLVVHHAKNIEITNLLENLPKLKSIKFDLINFVNRISWHLLHVLNNLTTEKKLLRRYGLQIYLKEKQISDLEQVYADFDYYLEHDCLCDCSIEDELEVEDEKEDEEEDYEEEENYEEEEDTRDNEIDSSKENDQEIKKTEGVNDQEIDEQVYEVMNTLRSRVELFFDAVTDSVDQNINGHEDSEENESQITESGYDSVIFVNLELKID